MPVCTQTEYREESSFCKQCDFAEICKDDKPVVTEDWQKKLTAAADLYRQGKVLEEQASYLLEQANETFKSYTKETGEFQYRIAQLSVLYKSQTRETYSKPNLLKLFTEEQIKPAAKITTYPVLRVTDLLLDHSRKRE